MASTLRVNTITDAAGTGAPTLTNGAKGSITGVTPAAGVIGEVMSNNFSGVSAAATGTQGNIGSISLTAGNWLIIANATLVCGATTSFNSSNSNSNINLSLTSASTAGTTDGIDLTQFLPLSTATSTGRAASVVVFKSVSFSSTTSVYLNGQTTYTSTTPTWTGGIRAVRLG